ncbi:hypothetical protein IAR55_003135 [Kwoniella newhampshirensis]|uniref:ER-bound oxygenase mpaB/mpaB'/Rubber oxygenase catalytic domain-containing protein n=1 Tax=Kwoniella newhampshirensis TaxID=1651941 RepID=A0AAW0Z0E0_9TREE
MFTIGDPSSAIRSDYAIITHGDQLEGLKPAALISPLGDYSMEWDELCLPPSKLEPWRHEGDDLCDSVVRAINLRPGQDGLQVLLDHLELPKAEQAECVKTFWDQISQPPPASLSAYPDDSNEATPIEAIRSCSRRLPPSVAAGQAVFWRYSAQILSALMHFSLAAGFSAERIVGVLRETNYLTGDAKDKTYRRLLETTQAIFDYMNDLTPVTGVGWKSTIRVRMLHSSVRVRLRDKKGLKNKYDEKVDGVPINQEDLLATLGSFAIAPLWSLRKSGIRLTAQEEAAYVAVWRHIGFYLGISPSRLEVYYTGPDLVSRAAKLFACLTMHLFSFDLEFDDYRATSTYRILASVAERPPRPSKIEKHLATSRFLIGDKLADKLLIPPTPRRIAFQLGVARAVDWALISFGRVYGQRWEIERVTITKLLVTMVVCWQLGVKRTKFTIKTFGADTTRPPPIEIGDSKTNIVDNAHSETEKDDISPTADDDDLDASVPMGPVAGKRIIRRWQWLLAEMAGVVLAPVGIALASSYWLLRHW